MAPREPGWKVTRITHIREDIVLLIDRDRLGEVQEIHPDKVIYLPEEFEELVRHGASEDYPKTLELVHEMKRQVRGWLLPTGTPGPHGHRQNIPDHPKPPKSPPARPSKRDAQVTLESVRKVDAIRDRAMALGWSRTSLYSNAGELAFPFGHGFGLVCFVHGFRTIGEVTTETIEILQPTGDNQTRRLVFHNPEILPPWVREVDR